MVAKVLLKHLTQATHGQIITIPVHNPFMQPIQASYGMTGDEQTRCHRNVGSQRTRGKTARIDPD